MPNRPPLFIFATILFLGLVCLAATEEPKREHERTPELPGAVTETPEWLGENLPFDPQRFFDAPAEQNNAATLYLKAFLELAPREMEICFSHTESYENSDSWELREERLDKLLNALEEDAPIEPSRLESVLIERRRGLELLEQAQQRERCVFQSGIGFLTLTPHLAAARTAARVLTLTVHRNLRQVDLDSAVENLRPLLRLSRDLQPRGNRTQQLVSVVVEQQCLLRLLPRVLASEKLTAAHCERLLQILVEHQSLQEIDPLIESERHYHLEWRKLLHELENGHYDDPVQRAKDLGIRNASTIGSVLVPVLNTIGGHDFNAEVAEEFVAEVSQGEARASRLLKELQRNPDSSEKLLRVIVALALTRALDLDPMTAADYRRERELLNRRYHQIVDTAPRSLPRRIKELDPLYDRWTRDDQWRETKILKLFHPHGLASLVTAVGRVQVQLRCAIAATALRRWTVQNELSPNTLLEALESADVQDATRDPFSGEPLKMIRRGDRLVIYSVGPDGDDDRAPTRVPYGKFNREPPPDGDIGFALTFPSN